MLTEEQMVAAHDYDLTIYVSGTAIYEAAMKLAKAINDGNYYIECDDEDTPKNVSVETVATALNKTLGMFSDRAIQDKLSDPIDLFNGRNGDFSHADVTEYFEGLLGIPRIQVRAIVRTPDGEQTATITLCANPYFRLAGHHCQEEAKRQAAQLTDGLFPGWTSAAIATVTGHDRYFAIVNEGPAGAMADRVRDAAKVKAAQAESEFIEAGRKSLERELTDLSLIGASYKMPNLPDEYWRASQSLTFVLTDEGQARLRHIKELLKTL